MAIKLNGIIIYWTFFSQHDLASQLTGIILLALHLDIIVNILLNLYILNY